LKAPEEIANARSVLVETLKIPGLNSEQRAMFCGMLNALAWVRGSPNGTTLDRLIAGEPVAAGKDPSAALQRLDSLPLVDVLMKIVGTFPQRQMMQPHIQEARKLLAAIDPTPPRERTDE
jgi:hypothetical protein